MKSLLFLSIIWLTAWGGAAVSLARECARGLALILREDRISRGERADPKRQPPVTVSGGRAERNRGAPQSQQNITELLLLPHDTDRTPCDLRRPPVSGPLMTRAPVP